MSENQKKIENIAEKYKIRDIYIFGSEATKFTRPGSDLDIGIIFQHGLPASAERMKIYGNIFSELSTEFVNKKIDLVFLEETPVHFQFKALTEGKLIYSSDLNKTFDYKENIINKYRDLKYFINEFYQGVLETSFV